MNESAGEKLWKRRAQTALGNRRSDFHFSHSFNNNKLDDRNHFLQNAKTSVASLRRLITPTRNADHDQPGTLIIFIGIRNRACRQSSGKRRGRRSSKRESFRYPRHFHSRPCVPRKTDTLLLCQRLALEYSCLNTFHRLFCTLYLLVSICANIGRNGADTVT